ncbi:hypothetical protein [Catenovulum agarivorans]|uniref:hypothetical protein n=1 Tax=Catenovulum agarivorans TaxID=1172192 RepID=UPI0002FFB5A4|nr:hypothetical protein [Catenovulum agarivorans]
MHTIQTLIKYIFILQSLLSLMPIHAYANSGNQECKCVTHVAYLEDSTNYFADLLHLALEKSKYEFGEFTTERKTAISTKQRMRRLLADNQYFDVLWSNSNPQREKELLAVKFDILKGLNQYKLLLIHPERQDHFNHIFSLADLSAFIGISALHWHDTEVFRRNGLKITTGPDYDRVIKMFHAKRADYFPRSAYIVWQELEQSRFSGLSIEKHLVLRYDASYFFFVSPDNPSLAQRILHGLKIAEADGSFDQLFFSDPYLAKGWAMVKQPHLTILNLK